MVSGGGSHQSLHGLHGVNSELLKRLHDFNEDTKQDTVTATTNR